MLTRANPDRDLIRLCEKAVEALKADLVACDAQCDALEVFERVRPEYPVLPNGWRYSYGDTSAADLRDALKRGRSDATPTWLANMRDQIKAVTEWERRVDEVRKSTGLHAAEIRDSRTRRRAYELMDQVAETSAVTTLGAAHKAAVVQAWLDAGYGLDGRGEALTLNILDEIRLLGTGGNNGGRISISHGYQAVARKAPDMATAA